MILHVVYQCALGLLSRRFLLREVEASDKGSTSAPRRTAAATAAKPQSSATNESQRRGSTPEEAHHTWKFQPLPTNQQQEASQSATAGSRTDLGRELDSLLQQNRLVETDSVAELADAVRRLHDILKTVEMNGTNARFAKIANEFAKAMKLVDGRPTSTLFGNQLGSELEGSGPTRTRRRCGRWGTTRKRSSSSSAEARARVSGSRRATSSRAGCRGRSSNNNNNKNQQPPPPMGQQHHNPLSPPGWHDVSQQQQQHPPSHHISSNRNNRSNRRRTCPIPLGAPIFASDMRHSEPGRHRLCYSGVFNPATAAAAGGGSGGVGAEPEPVTDMSDLNYPNWAWMAGGHNVYPYMNMGPTGG
ncbi:transcriptional regulatory protein C3C7.04 [Apiospora arundinis]